MPQDFSGQNLRGRSFKGQDLTGANFSNADIRGANFTNALLIGANFRSAKAGLQKYWIAGLLTVSLLLSLFAGFNSAITGYLAIYYFLPGNDFSPVAGTLVLLAYATFFVVIIRQGITTTLAFVQVAGIVAVVCVTVFAIALAVAGVGIGSVTVAFAIIFVIASIVAIAFVTVFATVFAVADTAALAIVGVSAIAIAITVAKAAVAIAGTVAITFTRIGSVAGSLATKVSDASNHLIAVAFAIIFAVAITLLSSYVGWRSFKGDEKYAWVRQIAIGFAATKGTSFRGANLTDADFTSATLKSTDLRGAILSRTCWHKAKMLDRVRPGITYLQNAQLQQVLVTGLGQDKNFDRQDLRGINLQGANLADASFIGADLSAASLQDADLSRAKLVQTQLDETDLTGATLTGACIEDWGITTHTKLDGVICEYIFMQYVEPKDADQNRRRKPDYWEEKFEDGDFADFIKPIVDTLDLYHNKDIDPRAIAISFKQLAENNPDAELRIVGMEVRGEDKFLLRAKTAPNVDKSQLSAEYFDTYNQIKALAEQDIKLLLAEKDKHILRLENMVMTALERPSFYSNVEQVGFMSNNPGGISQSNTGSMSGGMQAAQGDNNQQTMETHAVTPDGKQLTQQEVIQMMAQIEELVKGNTELPAADKEKSLKYLGAAKEEVQATEPDKQLAAGNLKRGVDTLKTASEAVASGKTLWENVKPILVQLPGWLGVAKSFFGF